MALACLASFCLCPLTLSFLPFLSPMGLLLSGVVSHMSPRVRGPVIHGLGHLPLFWGQLKAKGRSGFLPHPASAICYAVCTLLVFRIACWAASAMYSSAIILPTPLSCSIYMNESDCHIVSSARRINRRDVANASQSPVIVSEVIRIYSGIG